jgi:hypothetical protein
VVGFFELFSEQLALTSVQKLQDFCASQRPLEAPGLVPLSECIAPVSAVYMDIIFRCQTPFSPFVKFFALFRKTKAESAENRQKKSPNYLN